MALGSTVVSPPAASARVTFSNTARLSVDVGSDGTQAFVLADVNKDNRPDIIAVSQDTNQVNVVLNDGNGGFGAGPNPFSVGAGPVAVDSGDFDRDGNIDIVTVNGDGNTVTILFGDGTGAFNAGRQDYSVDPAPVSVAVADFNNDQIPDLAVLSDSTVYLLKSNGDRTFSPFSPVRIGTRSTGGFAIAPGFFNSDLFPDLVISNIDSDNISVFLGNGNGTFKAATLLSTRAAPTGIAVGDWDLDGKSDIAVVNSGEVATENVSLWFGDGNGAFPNPPGNTPTTAEVCPYAIATADFDGDGRLDLAVTNGTRDPALSILINDPNHPDDPSVENGFRLTEPILGLAQLAVQADDLNGDGRPDVVAVGDDTQTINVFINTTGTSSPSPAATPTPTTEPSPSATPTPLVRISIGSAVGRPEDIVDITVSLVASGVPVAATANDIAIDSGALTLDPAGCRVNPAIGKSLVVSTFMPNVFEPATKVRVFVATDQRPDPIPYGPLYTCTFRVAPWALPGTYVLTNDTVMAFEPAGTQLASVSGSNGVVIVTLVTTPLPTRTATAAPTGTTTAAPATGGGGSGCSIGSFTDTNPASNCLVFLSVLLLARRAALRRRQVTGRTEP